MCHSCIFVCYHTHICTLYTIWISAPATLRASWQATSLSGMVAINHKALQRLVYSAYDEWCSFSTKKTSMPRRCQNEARRIFKINHSDNSLFSLLWSGRMFWTDKVSTERFRKSFYFQNTKILNEDLSVHSSLFHYFHLFNSIKISLYLLIYSHYFYNSHK